MPFVAIRDDDQAARVYIGDYEDPRHAFDGVRFVCTDCRAPMGIRMGEIVRAHFYHLPDKESRPCYWRTYAESEQHMACKRLIAKYLKEDSELFHGGLIEIEYPVTTPDGRRRYIDVYCETPDGRRFAHEIQLSPQSLDTFWQRTADYRSIDLETIWWLGGAAKTRENQTWVERECAYGGEITMHTYQNVVDEVWYDSRGNAKRNR